MFNPNLTPQTIDVLKRANVEAHTLSHREILSSHILIALLQSEDSEVFSVFEGHGITVPKVRSAVMNYVPVSTTPIGSDTMIASDSAEAVVKRAVAIAMALGRAALPIDLAIALLDSPDRILELVFASLNVSPRILLVEFLKKARNMNLGVSLPNSNDSKRVTKLPTLEAFSIELTAPSYLEKLSMVYNREKEILRLSEILCRRSKANPLLLGEPGVGKTAVVEGLALNIAHNNVPEPLLGMRIFSLDMGLLSAGTALRGSYEERLKKILSESLSQPNIILFIDEIHSLIGAGASSSGVLDASNILKPYLSKGQLRLIGATTFSEYHKYFEKDAAMSRRFSVLEINPPNVSETTEILRSSAALYEKHHNVSYSPETFAAISRLADRYITDRFMPDKALDVLDEAGALVGMRTRGDGNESQKIVKFEDIAQVVSSWAQVPIDVLTQSPSEKIINLKESLGARIVGQDKAIDVLTRAIWRRQSGLGDPKRPLSFLFVGPTGVGKTAIVKELARVLDGSTDKLIQIDMSEYGEAFNVSRLIGAPPGYVGHNEPGQLTEAVRRNPSAIILLDEFDKADKAVADLLLQVFEDGKLTAGDGRIVNFSQTTIILTANTPPNKGSVGFGVSQTQAIDANELLKGYRVEFLNRIDEIVTFSPLDTNGLGHILAIMLDELNERLRDSKGLSVRLLPEAEENLLRMALRENMGARPLRRLLENVVEHPLVDLILRGKVTAGQEILVGLLADDYFLTPSDVPDRISMVFEESLC
jgi:ATP-dependent Clp protease ATP-binding subunit ClpC